MMTSEQIEAWTKKQSEWVLQKMGYELEGSLTVHEQFIIKYNQYLETKPPSKRFPKPARKTGVGRPRIENPSPKTIYNRVYRERMKNLLAGNS